MVAMNVCGKRRFLSADDLKCPCTVVMIVRLGWCWLVAGTIAVLDGAQGSQNCSSAALITAFLYACLVVSVAAFLVSFRMRAIAQRGTLSDAEPRASQATLLTIWVALQVLALVFAGFGLAVLVWDAPCTLENADGSSDATATVLLWMVVVWQMLSVCWLMLANSLVPASNTTSDLVGVTSWSDKCRRGCRCMSLSSCCLFGGWSAGRRGGHHADPYQGASEVLWSLFGGQWRRKWFTPTDIAAGLALVRASYLRAKPSTTPVPAALSQSEQASLDYQVGQLAHYSKYTVGVYGPLLYLFSELFPPAGRCCCGMFAIGKLCCRCGGGGVVTGDNCWGMHRAAFTHRALQDESAELVFADFDVDVCRTPYGVVVDHSQRAVVVTIRGTISLIDCVTDGLAKTVDLDCAATLGHPAPVYTHQGFLETAKVIYKELKKSRLLRILTKDAAIELPAANTHWLAEHAPALLALVQDSEGALHRLALRCEGYQVVVVGHSLGAGVAAVLAAMLYGEVDKLHAYAYSCPGAVFDVGFSRSPRMQQLVTSVVLADDMIPRTTLKNVERLRNRVVSALEECPLSKSEVFDNSIAETNEGAPAWMAHPLELGHSEQTEMALAGRIVYLERQGEGLDEVDETRKALLLRPSQLCCGVDTTEWVSNLKVRWAEQEEFLEIKPSPLMVLDHFPDRVHAALLALMPRCTPADQYTGVQVIIEDDIFHDSEEMTSTTTTATTNDTFASAEEMEMAA